MSATKPADPMHWDNRAEQWAKAAPEGLSTDDANNQLLIQLAEVGPGMRVLDMAAGMGEPAISIALKVGETGSVVASDVSAPMLAGAEKRVQTLGFKNIDFQVTGMESLPFEDNSFDAVTCRFGLMHADDALAGTREAFRVLKPGGWFAAMVHGPRERNTLYSVIRKTVFDFRGESDEGFGLRRFRFSGDGELTALFKEAGFSSIEERSVDKDTTKPMGADFWKPQLYRAFDPKVKDLSPDRVVALESAVQAAFDGLAVNGEVPLHSCFRAVRGRKVSH